MTNQSNALAHHEVVLVAGLTSPLIFVTDLLTRIVSSVGVSLVTMLVLALAKPYLDRALAPKPPSPPSGGAP